MFEASEITLFIEYSKSTAKLSWGFDLPEYRRVYHTILALHDFSNRNARDLL